MESKFDRLLQGSDIETELLFKLQRAHLAELNEMKQFYEEMRRVADKKLDNQLRDLMGG